MVKMIQNFHNCVFFLDVNKLSGAKHDYDHVRRFECEIVFIAVN